MRVPHLCHLGCTIPPSDHTDWIVLEEKDMTGNIENAARTLGDAIRYAAETIAAALRQNSWTYQPPVQTIPNTVPYVPYQPYTSPTIQPYIHPTVTCESNSSLPRTASVAGMLCQSSDNIDRYAGSAGDPDIRFSNRD